MNAPTYHKTLNVHEYGVDWGVWQRNPSADLGAGRVSVEEGSALDALKKAQALAEKICDAIIANTAEANGVKLETPKEPTPVEPRFKREHVAPGWSRLTITAPMLRGHQSRVRQIDCSGDEARARILNYAFSTVAGALEMSGHPKISELVSQVSDRIQAAFYTERG